MDSFLNILLPYLLVLGRVSGFVAAAPLLNWAVSPVAVRVGLALLLTLFFVMAGPALPAAPASAVMGGVMMAGEVAYGLALGLVINLGFLAVKQAGGIAGIQMGLTLAEIIDPATNEEEGPMGLLLENVFVLVLLAAGGHHLLVRALGRSFSMLPTGQMPDVGALAEGLIQGGSAMFLFSLKLAGPILAGLLLLSVILAVVARVVPEMNVLLLGLPVQILVGLVLAAAMVPTLGAFTDELSRWLAGLVSP